MKHPTLTGFAGSLFGAVLFGPDFVKNYITFLNCDMNKEFNLASKSFVKIFFDLFLMYFFGELPQRIAIFLGIVT
ncbi:hypothetical protein DRJ25_00105 [Candidatus Woesearchaeota archaeon]|nr:MAG: hypothetical protein DRJ25_00105 [Candidatus Woesearchaeota archaeon]